MRLFTLLLLMAPVLGNAQCFDPGDGSDGGFHATVDTSIAGATYNFSSFEIDAGITVTVTGTSPLEVNCSGTLTVNGGNGTDGVTFTSAGTGGIGVAGGQNGGDGVYSTSGPLDGSDGMGTGGTGTFGSGWSGGGGAGYASTGSSSGGAGGAGGASYGDAAISGFETGSGGGGGSGGVYCGSGGGGAGGGLIIINAYSLVISATGAITSNGGNGGSDGTGNCGGGGGGSGGSIIITSPSITNDGTISATGGVGGLSNVPGTPYYGTGANGSDGRIRLDGPYTGTGSVTPAAGSTSPAISLPGTSTQTLSICSGDSVVVLTNVYTVTGIYEDTIAGGAANGCDSIITTDLTVETVDFGVTLAGALFTANQSGATYQWVNCADSSAISGETNQTYTATTNGSYAVIVTVGGCSDTSMCQTFDQTGLEDLSANSFTLYPNPTSGQFTVTFTNSVSAKQVTITDLIGKVVYELKEVNNESIKIDLSDFETGVYILNVRINGQTESLKVIKN